MIELIQVAQGVIERGLIFGFVVAGVYLSSRLIKFDNLAIEGAFGLGGALTALLISWDVNPWLVLVLASSIGGVSGIVTGMLNTNLRLNHLMSGIVVTTASFSLMLKIAGSHMGLAGKNTIFTTMPACVAPYQQLIVLAGLCILVFGSLSWLLKTEVGYLLHAVGDTPQMLINVGKSVGCYIRGGLALSNLLAGFAGGLFVQYVGYFSVWTGVGILIVGLAGMMLADLLSRRFGLGLLFGAIVYQALITLTFELQLDQDWNKLITALLIVILMALQRNAQHKGVSRC